MSYLQPGILFFNCQVFTFPVSTLPSVGPSLSTSIPAVSVGFGFGVEGSVFTATGADGCCCSCCGGGGGCCCCCGGGCCCCCCCCCGGCCCCCGGGLKKHTKDQDRVQEWWHAVWKAQGVTSTWRHMCSVCFTANWSRFKQFREDEGTYGCAIVWNCSCLKLSALVPWNCSFTLHETTFLKPVCAGFLSPRFTLRYCSEINYEDDIIWILLSWGAITLRKLV